MQSVPITTKVVSSNPAHGEEELDATVYDEVLAKVLAFISVEIL